MIRPAVFLDRDGVLNVDHGYVFQPCDFEPVPGVFQALRAASAYGYALVVITNQSGIGRGYFSQSDYDALELHMRNVFAAEGVTFTAIAHCPHHPAAGCICRKPKPEMILRAARDHSLDLSRSVMIGDKPSDTEAGRAAGIGRLELIPSNTGIKDIVARLSA